MTSCRDALAFTSRICAGALVTLGSVVLVGWWRKVEWLMSVSTGHASMKPNTAIGFMAFGLALAFASRRAAGDDPLWAIVGRRGMAALAGTCGALTLCEYAFHVNLHIDELLFADPVPTTYPGRMAYITATNFCLAGLAFWMMDGGRVARKMAPWAALVDVADAYAGIVGYLYGIPIFYGALGYTAMALHTGLGFLVLGLGMLAAQSDSGFTQICAPEPGNWLARRLLPIVVVAPVVLGWVYLHPAVSFGHPRFAMALFAGRRARGSGFGSLKRLLTVMKERCGYAARGRMVPAAQCFECSSRTQRKMARRKNLRCSGSGYRRGAWFAAKELQAGWRV